MFGFQEQKAHMFTEKLEQIIKFLFKIFIYEEMLFKCVSELLLI